MRSLLDALQEGRLIELPTSDKHKSLELLAVLIEAVPGISKIDIVKGVLDREELANTAIGKGVACPHLRVRQEGDMVCAVGWSRQGIDYGAPDAHPVHLVIMYYVPDSDRNAYLKEVSGLAKSVMNTTNMELFEEAADIDSIRNKLLDWVDISISRALPDAKGRMIRLEAKQAAAPVTAELPLPADSVLWEITPFMLILLENHECKILSQDMDLVKKLENDCTLYMTKNKGQMPHELDGYQIRATSQSTYSLGREVYNCVAIRFKDTATNSENKAEPTRAGRMFQKIDHMAQQAIPKLWPGDRRRPNNQG
jgi:mannitol/fructose-specific phosphotransferase system IIA component (Ntr-type)